MAKSNNFWVVKADKGWAVRQEGNPAKSGTFTKQSDAIDAAKSLAKATSGELIVQNRQGQIREKNTYGNDPFPPHG